MEAGVRLSALMFNHRIVLYVAGTELGLLSLSACLQPPLRRGLWCWRRAVPPFLSLAASMSAWCLAWLSSELWASFEHRAVGVWMSCEAQPERGSSKKHREQR